jgi:hypothetical protein
MKKIIVVLVLMFVPNMVKADEFNVRLLVHGHKEIREGFGVAGWVIAPNITSAPNKWLVIAGPRYEGQGWNIELLAGAVIVNGVGKALVDTRLELTPKLFNLPIYTWHNLQWIASGGKGTLYWYSQLDYVLPKGIGLLGVEIENSYDLEARSGDFSVAPHAVLPLGDHFALIAAPQFHFSEVGKYTGFQMWVRTVVNF